MSTVFPTPSFSPTRRVPFNITRYEPQTPSSVSLASGNYLCGTIQTPISYKILSCTQLAVGCTPRSCLSACRGGRGCSPRSCVSACRGGRGCTPRSCISPCRADTGCHHTMAFLLSMRASFSFHRVSCTTVSRRFHVRPRVAIAFPIHSSECIVASEASVRER
jgi:hypothetical protein